MLDRDVGRVWQLWGGFALLDGTQVHELLLEAGELVDDHPRLRSLPHHPLAQRLQDVGYRLTVLLLLLAHKWCSCPRNPTQGGIVERQVGVLRRGGSCQGSAALGNLRRLVDLAHLKSHLARCCVGPTQMSGRSRQGGIVGKVGVGENGGGGVGGGGRRLGQGTGGGRGRGGRVAKGAQLSRLVVAGVSLGANLHLGWTDFKVAFRRMNESRGDIAVLYLVVNERFLSGWERREVEMLEQPAKENLTLAGEKEN